MLCTYLKIGQFRSLELSQAMLEKFVIMLSAEKETVLKRPVIAFRRAKTPAGSALIQIVGHTFHLKQVKSLIKKSQLHYFQKARENLILYHNWANQRLITLKTVGEFNLPLLVYRAGITWPKIKVINNY